MIALHSDEYVLIRHYHSQRVYNPRIQLNSAITLYITHEIQMEKKVMMITMIM